MSTTLRALPDDIAGIAVPADDVSRASWSWARRQLPGYLLNHSVRSYAWGATIAAREGWAWDRAILWNAALFHDVGLTTLPRNTMCFEVEGAEMARRRLERAGMPVDRADRVAIAIILHMRPAVTLDDDVEAVLLDRATGLDVRGVGFGDVDEVRGAVTAAWPRGAFDRRFLAAIEREARARSDCQSTRLLDDTGLARSMARSPWAVTGGPATG
jgi:hypothetical protein